MKLQERVDSVRLRRLRQNAAVRDLVGSAPVSSQKMLWPVFVVEGSNVRQPIDTLPGQCRYSIDTLPDALDAVRGQGIGGVVVFGAVEDCRKDSHGSYAWCDSGLVQQAVRAAVARFPDLPVFTDVCLCAYTDHGHCGPLTDAGRVDNDATLALLAQVALSHAAAGAHGVAPSAMMDGQVAAIRQALTSNGFDNTLLMSYSTKFASAMYGPFRTAAGSTPVCYDRSEYQTPFNDVKQALRESMLDEQEGADILMVKPALFYLDIIHRIRESTNLPLAAYNVSGEYAMLHAMADRGWGELRAMARESLAAIIRAGADIVISYWASRYNELFAGR